MSCEKSFCNELTACSHSFLFYPLIEEDQQVHLLIMPPALMCCAGNLLLSTAVFLQHCRLVRARCVPGARPSSAVEDVIFSSPLTSPEMSLGLHGQQLLKDNSIMTVL